MEGDSTNQQHGKLRHRPQAQEQSSTGVEMNEHASSGNSKHKNDCCMRFISSTPFKMIMFSVVSVVPLYGTLCTLPEILEHRGCTDLFCKIRHYGLVLWISVQFLYNFHMSQFVDPGGSLHIKPTYEASGQFEMNLNGLEESMETKRTILYAPNFCEWCQHWKPPRSHHCSICKRCVLRMDHHCPFVGNCIGMRNHGHFILMYIFAFIGLIYSLYSCISVILTTKPHVNFSSHKLLQNPQMMTGLSSLILQAAFHVLFISGPWVTLQTVLTCISLIAVLSFGSPALYFACTGQTLLEAQFPMKEYVQIKPQVYCPLGPGFYHWSCKQNLRDLLGAKWWLRLLAPVRGGIFDLRPAVEPRPSPKGIEALLQRFEEVEKRGVTLEAKSVRELGFNLGPINGETAV